MYFDDANNQDRDQRLETLMQAGQLDEALGLLQAWQEQEPWNSEVWMRLAVVHWLSGQPALTLRDLDALIELEPDNAEALARRAQALLMLGKHEDAEATLTRAEQLDPTTPGVLLNRALVREEHGAYGDSIDLLTAYLEQVPQDHLALARRSHLHRQLGSYPQALADAQACVAMQPQDPESHFAEALARVTLEQGAEALASTDRCLQLQPAFLPALRLKVDLLADMERVPEAEVVLAELRQQAGTDSPHTLLLEARLASEHGEYPDALRWIGRYLDEAPDDAYGYYRRGMIYFRMESFEDALADFQQYATLAPQALEAYEQQFLCFLQLQRYEEAAQVGRTAVDLQPGNYRLQYNFAFAELLCGRLDTALAGFHRAMEGEPLGDELPLRVHLALSEHAPLPVRISWFRTEAEKQGIAATMVQGLLAEAYLEAEEYEQALAITRAVLAYDNTLPFGYLLGVKALCLLERYPEALDVADRGVSVLPDDGRIRLARSLVLRDMGRPEDALAELERAQVQLPGDAEVVRQQALVYGSIGEFGHAVRLLDVALRMDADNPEAHFWLAYFQVHLKRYRPALLAAERLLALVPELPEGRLMRGAALRGLGRHEEAEEEFRQAQAGDPALLDRLSADPVIAGLLDTPKRGRFGTRMRRSATHYWNGLLHMMGNG